MKKLIVHTASRHYPVEIGSGAWSALRAYLASVSAVVVTTDDRVAGLYGKKLCGPLHDAGIKVNEWTLPSGEQSKSLWQAECFYDFLASRRIDRGGAIIALGGGTVGDLAGYVAGTWLRGISFINCPTTLLSMIDASIGGKCGVNHGGLKNAVGVVYQPAAVLADLSSLPSLPERQQRSAMAESIKHAVIADPEFLRWQVQHADEIRSVNLGVIEELVVRNVEIKSKIVEQDEFDTGGQRARLNLGHTIGHALEMISDFQWTHGECIALGIVCAVRIARHQTLIDDQEVQEIEHALESFGLPTRINGEVHMEHLQHLIRGDKKSLSATPRFVLPTAIGKVIVGRQVDENLIQTTVQEIVQR